MDLPFICPDCGKASWNRDDLKHGWCNICKKGWLERGLEEVIAAKLCDHEWDEPFYTRVSCTLICLKCGITQTTFED
jgi:hypothetical protein